MTDDETHLHCTPSHFSAVCSFLSVSRYLPQFTQSKISVIQLPHSYQQLVKDSVMDRTIPVNYLVCIDSVLRPTHTRQPCCWQLLLATMLPVGGSNVAPCMVVICHVVCAAMTWDLPGGEVGFLLHGSHDFILIGTVCTPPKHQDVSAMICTVFTSPR